MAAKTATARTITNKVRTHIHIVERQSPAQQSEQEQSGEQLDSWQKHDKPPVRRIGCKTRLKKSTRTAFDADLRLCVLVYQGREVGY